MLTEAAVISDSITSSSLYVPWSAVETESSNRIMSDLKACFEKAVERRRVVKDTSEQWYRLGAVRPSSGESSSQYGVRISTVGEEGNVDYVPVAAPSHKFLVKVVVSVPQEKEKRKCLPVQWKYVVSSKCLVRLPAPVNALWSMIQLLLLLWHLNLPEEKRERVDEMENLLQFCKEDYHNCFVSCNYCTPFFSSDRLPWAILLSRSYCFYNL